MLSNDLVHVVHEARTRGMRARPTIGGFPYLAESLRDAGISAVHCDVASMSTIYRSARGAVVDQQEPLTRGLDTVASFDRDAVVTAIRRDQNGESTYAEFMVGIWKAGVVSYDIDLHARTCAYQGVDPLVDLYVEEYALVMLDHIEA
jgi:uncharacterized protein YbcV (DUF1398 family)